MQKRAQKEAKSTHSDSDSSQQHLMKTPSAEDEKGYSTCQFSFFCACSMAVAVALGAFVESSVGCATFYLSVLQGKDK